MGRIIDQDVLFERLITGDRNALAQAITLVENEHPDKMAGAAALLGRCMPYRGNAIRIGISGPPGAGKSTLIDVLGKHAINMKYKVAVLAVDPSSERSGGSILGDKTRMSDLASEQDAFVRPSPAGGHLGGTASATHDAILLCETAGYDMIIIETVGVGQSETDACYLSDCFVLVTIPGSGDVLQGIKKGIMEISDIIVVNKADGVMKEQANRAVLQIKEALHFGRRNIDVPVCPTSATEGEGIASLLNEILSFITKQQSDSFFEDRRQHQELRWLKQSVHEYCIKQIDHDTAVRKQLDKAGRDIAGSKLHTRQAAMKIVSAFFGKNSKKIQKNPGKRGKTSKK